ncbi:PREDICTED: ribokinase-like [Priapulus caudatus]|uniref:Ribokinase n=1 Tax=Priapulus caudatus TaxID=37621 RepID=A0ABM1E188_PRICU|nr:PREDICTED: ribokinase-like [Priapulus caudatus]
MAGVVEVVVVGSCNTDLITYTARFPNPGETIHGHSFSIGFGGKGANQAVCAARLGASTAMIGKVGNDTFGNDTTKNFQNNNINIDHLGMEDGTSTGTAVITVDESGQNSIVIVNGANSLLSKSDVSAAEPMIARAKILVCQLEVEPEVSIAAMKLARQHNVMTLFNPAPARANLPPDAWTLCDVFCPNEAEAEMFAGMPVKAKEDAEKASLFFLDKGCKIVIITLGDKGAVYVTQENRTPVHVPCRVTKVVDTTGAGDAFAGALAYYMACHPGLAIGQVIRRSCEIARMSVQHSGTQNSYPVRQQIPDELFL